MLSDRSLIVMILLIQAALGWWNYSISQDVHANFLRTEVNARVADANRERLLTLAAASDEKSKKLDIILDTLRRDCK